MVAIVSQYGCPQRSRVVSHITSGFPHHEIMCPSINYPVFCNEESMKQVLELLIMVYADDIKGGVTHSICEFNVKAVQ